MRDLLIVLFLVLGCLMQPPMLQPPCSYCREYLAHPLYEGWCEWCWMHKVPPEEDPHWTPAKKWL